MKRYFCLRHENVGWSVSQFVLRTGSGDICARLCLVCVSESLLVDILLEGKDINFLALNTHVSSSSTHLCLV